MTTDDEPGLLTALQRAYRDAIDGYRTELERSGLTVRQAELLLAVAAHPGRGVQFTARQIGADLPTASALVARLEERGLLERSTDPEDRRRVRLVVTKQAQPLAKQVSRAWRTANERVGRAAGPDAARAQKLLERLALALEADSADTADDPPR